MKPLVLLLKALAVYAVSLVSMAFAYSRVTIRPGPFPAEGMMSAGTAVLVVHALIVAVLLLLAARARVPGLGLALMLFVALFGIQTAMMQIETLAFNASVGMPLSTVGGLVAAAAFNAACVAGVAALLFRPAPAGPYPLPAGIAWRFAATTLLYVVAYYAAGYFIAWSFEAVRTYYQGGVNIDQRFLIPFQIFRGALWSAIALYLALRIKGPAWQRIAILALVFAVLTTAQLLYPNSYMPAKVASAHAIEIFTSEAIWAALAAWLLGPQRE